MLRDVLTALTAWSVRPVPSPAPEVPVAAIATVVEVHGSAPLPVGTVMAVRADGVVAGAISGGCVEQQVVEVARSVAAGAPARRLRFAPDADLLVDSGLPCGGGIDVLVEAWRPSAGQAAFARAVLAGEPATLRSESGCDHGLVLREAQVRRRAVLIGAGLVAEAITELAGGLDWEVVIVDPREAFAARSATLPAARLLPQWPRAALAALSPLGPRDALLALSHHPALDDEALELGLATDAGFVGALGSRRTHAERIARLRDRGVSEAALARIVGPIGLDLGGWSPREVALSVVAELVAVGHGRDGGRLASRRGPIHAPPALGGLGEVPAATFGSQRAPEEIR